MGKLLYSNTLYSNRARVVGRLKKIVKTSIDPASCWFAVNLQYLT